MKIDKEADFNIFLRFLNHPNYSGKRAVIFKYYPELLKQINNGEEEKEVVRKFIDESYSTHNECIEKIVNDITREIEYSLTAFSLLAKLMDYDDFGNKTYIAYPTFLPFSPFQDNTFFFSIYGLQVWSLKVVVTILHEISHFLFFEQLTEWGTKQNRKLDHPAIHYFKEALTTALLNHPGFKDIFDYSKLYGENTYLGNNELQNLSVSYNNITMNIIEFFGKEMFDNNASYHNNLYRLLELFSQKKDLFSIKWQLWNQHLSDPTNQKILKNYKEAILLD